MTRTPPRMPAVQSIAIGYWVAVCLSLLIALVATYALRSVVISKDRVEDIYAGDFVEVTRLRESVGRKAAATRDYLLTDNTAFLEESDATRLEFEEALARLSVRVELPSERALLDRIASAQGAYLSAVAHVIELGRGGTNKEDVEDVFEREAVPPLETLETSVNALASSTDERLKQARQAASGASEKAAQLVLIVAGAAVLLAAGLGILFSRTAERLRRASEERFRLLAAEQLARSEAESARRELAGTVQRLEQVNADLDAFAGRIAHDLRNILAPIGLSPARLRRAQDDEARERAVASLERSITRANAVLEGLLAFSRSGRPSEESRPALLREVVSEVVEELSSLAADARATLEVDVEETRIACAPELLHVVLQNLIGNAVKYISGSERRLVRVISRIEGESARITVEDTGPGIPAASLTRIFEPFYRVPGVRAPGTGIGLATVRRIVLAYGGRIDASSEEGKGTAFHVWLPLSKD